MNTQTVTDVLQRGMVHDTYWGKKILAAEKRGKFTPSNVNEAASWVTCACGKSITPIAMRPSGSNKNYQPGPVDDKLRHLGDEFHVNVVDNEFLYAAKTLVEIEERARSLAW